MDLNTGKPWSEMDLFDLLNSLSRGSSIEDTADFLCRSPREVAEKARELGLLPTA